MVAHFTSEKGILSVALLGLIELQGEHSGENQAVIILNVLNDYEICNKMGYMVIDNAPSNDTLIKAIITSLRGEGVTYNAQERRHRCNDYVINLAVQAFLFSQIVNNYDFHKNEVISLFNA